jgi:hypothetical protein
MNSKGYSATDEKLILDALGRSLLKEFPNPERIGCPGADILKRIASHEMSLSEAEKWLHHHFVQSVLRRFQETPGSTPAAPEANLACRSRR